MSNQEYLQAFLSESDENVRQLNEICLRFDGGDRLDADFAAFFRSAHTLKGMSATMGFTEMAQLTHRLEDALSFLRSDPSRLTQSEVDLLFASIDALDSMLANIRQTGLEGTTSWTGLVSQLDRVRAAPTAAPVLVDSPPLLAAAAQPVWAGLEALIQQSAAQGIPVAVVTVAVDPASVMKGPRAILVMRALEPAGDVLRVEPDAEALEAGSYDSEIQFLVALSRTTEDSLVTAVQNVSEVIGVKLVLVDDEDLRTDTHPDVPAGATPPAPPAPRPDATIPVVKDSVAAATRLDPTIRVPVQKLDVLMNLISELVIDRTRIARFGRDSRNAELLETVSHLARVSSDLQGAVMSLRLVPVDSLFQRFPRMVRDLSKALGKSIHLEMDGLETEFDRTIIDEMGEALVHLIRNAADHGLESEADRVAAGKSATGHLTLAAQSVGQDVLIEVRDDGRGVDTARVLARAVERGLVNAQTADSLRAEDVFALLFASGFSTVDTLSDISGRGVGLDAVKRKVESLGGTIEILSVFGQGTTFRIRLPLTLAIQQALLVVVHRSTLAIPLAHVVEVHTAASADVDSVHGQRCLRLGTRIVPVFDPGAWFFDTPVLADPPWRFVVCAEGGKQIAIAVNQLLGQEEIVHKSLGAYLGHLTWFSGGALLGDGRIALIADVRNWIA